MYTAFQRILRYLILWGIIFAILCIVSVIRHWDLIAAVMSGAFASWISLAISAGVLIGLFVWGFRLMLFGR